MSNYVKCGACDHWIEGRRHNEVCKLCNNTKMIRDPAEILCNMCGGPQRPLGTHNECYPHGIETKVRGGYDSYHIFDTITYYFNFCEKCLRNMFNQCKIPPITVDAYNDREYNYATDKEDYEYRLWKDNGGFHQAYLDKKCNFVKDCPNKALYTQYISDEFTEGCCCEDHKGLWGYGNSKLVKFISNHLKPFL